MDEQAGEITEAILFPTNFFIEETDRETDGSIMPAVAEGLPGVTRPSAIYQLPLK